MGFCQWQHAHFRDKLAQTDMAETTQNPMERATALVARLQASFGVNGADDREEDEEPLRYVR